MARQRHSVYEHCRRVVRVGRNTYLRWVTLENEEPKIVAPHGIDDLVNLIVRPTPSRKGDLSIFYKRIESKKWLEKWPKLRVVTERR